jgi:hypothetical protein
MCALSVVLGLLLAGCGGGSSDKKANETYASNVCAAIGSWQKEIKSITSDFSSGISKQSLKKKLTQFEAATDDLVSQLKAVPPPNTSQGQTAKDHVDQLATDVQQTTSAVKSAAAQLPENATLRQTATAIARLAPQAKALADSVQSTVATLRSAGGSLASAFQNSTNCKDLRG